MKESRSMNLQSAPPPEGSAASRSITYRDLPVRKLVRRISAIVIATMLALGAVFGVAAAANANPTPEASVSADGKTLTATNVYPEQTAQTDKGHTVVKGTSETKTEQTGHSYDEVTTDGVVTLEFNDSVGMTAKEVKKAEKLGQCKWMKDGYNSGNGWRNGQRMSGVWIDHTRQYVCHTGKGPSGYQVAKCKNYYWPKGHTPPKKYIRYKTVHLVRSLVGKTITGKISVNTVSNATGSSESWAETKQCKAHGMGSYTAHAGASAAAEFSIKISAKMDIKAKLRDAFVQFAMKQQTKYAGKAWAEASSKAQGEARSEASCEDYTPPPVVVTTPPQPTPTVTVTATATVSLPGTTETVSVPGPTQTVTVPGATQTVTVPGPEKTVTIPGPTQTITVPGPEKTVIKEVPVPGPTVTVTVPCTPTTDTPKPGKPTVNIERMNDQEIKTSTKGIKVSYVAPAGNPSIVIKADFGTITDVKDLGNGTVTFTYTAPTEGTPDGNATITATVTTGSDSATDRTTFKILVPGTPDNPGTPL